MQTVSIGSTEPLHDSTDLRILAGGTSVENVDLDSGRLRSVPEPPESPDDFHVTAFTESGGEVYALGRRCHGRGAKLMHIADSGRLRPVGLSGPVDGLLGGPSGVWGVDYGIGEDGPPALRPVTGGTIELPENTSPVAAFDTGLVATSRPDDATTGEPPVLVLLDPETGEVKRRLGKGRPVAAGDDFVLYGGSDCALTGSSPEPDAQRRCVLHKWYPDRAEHSEPGYPLPVNRAPGAAGTGVVSDDARFAAFTLAERSADNRYAMQHPIPQSEVAVLDLGTGDVQIVPDLQLPPKAGVGLAFSPDSRWLLLGTDPGGHRRLLAWRRGTEELRHTPARLPGRPARQMPLLVRAG